MEILVIYLHKTGQIQIEFSLENFINKCTFFDEILGWFFIHKLKQKPFLNLDQFADTTYCLSRSKKLSQDLIIYILLNVTKHYSCVWSELIGFFILHHQLRIVIAIYII